MNAGPDDQVEQMRHILSTLAYRFLKDEQKAALYAGLDRIARWIPGIRKVSMCIILIVKKI